MWVMDANRINDKDKRRNYWEEDPTKD
jgi:hypothetical protein